MLSLAQQAVKNTAGSPITEKFNKNKLSKTRILTTVTYFEIVPPITSFDTNGQTLCMSQKKSVTHHLLLGHQHHAQQYVK